MNIVDIVRSFNVSLSETNESTVKNPTKLIEALKETVQEAENLLARIAVAHDISVSLDGPYGAGRWVVLNPEEDGDYGYERGDWMTSSAAGC